MTPGSARARRYILISGPWSVFRFWQMPGYTQLGLRQAASISGVLQPMRYMLAVGPPRSEMTPVKPVTLSRISSISRMIDSSRAALDDAAFVLGDRAEGAAAEAAAHDVHARSGSSPRPGSWSRRRGCRSRRRSADAGCAHTAGRTRGPSPPWSAGSAAGSARRRGRRAPAPARGRCPGWSPGAARGWRGRTAPGRSCTCSYDGRRITVRSRGGTLSLRRAGLATNVQRLRRAGSPRRRATACASSFAQVAPCAFAWSAMVRYGIDVVLDAARRVDAGGIDLEPALGRVARARRRCRARR